MSGVYIRRYFINFVGKPDKNNISHSYQVDFFKRYAGVPIYPTPDVELEGGPTPFLLSLADDEDLLTPFRASTARISFVDDIELKNLLPSDAFEWKVTLTRLEDDKQIFIGYLTAEVYTQPAIEGPNIVTVNAVSPLSPIMATTMKILDIGSLSIGKLIDLAISECEGVESVYLPAQFTIEQAAKTEDFTDILHWQFSSANFINSPDSGVITGELYECESYSAALEAVCRLFGWSLTDTGDGAWYFVSPGYTGDYMHLTKSQLSVGLLFTPTMAQPSIGNESAIEPIDKADTIDFRQGVGSVMIKATGKSSVVELPTVESQITQWAYELSERQMWKNDGSTYDAVIGLRQALLGRGQISTPRYRATLITNSSGVLENVEWNVVEDGSVGEDDVMAEYLELDSCAPDAIQGVNGNPAEKREWSFQPSWRIDGLRRFPTGAADGAFVLGYIPDNFAYITYRGQVGALTSGAIKISFEVKAAWNEAFYLAADYTFGGGNIENTTQEELAINNTSAYVNPVFWGATKIITVSLSVGGKYWNGETWVSNFALFDIPVATNATEWHSIESNKTIEMPYPGSDGWYIPITTLLSGKLEFGIHAVHKYNGASARPDEYYRTGIYAAQVYVKGLTLTYTNTLDYSDATEGKSSFYKDFELSYTTKKEVTVPIHSRINSSEQMSLLLDSNYFAIDTVHRITSPEAAKPEQHLLANFERLFARTAQNLRKGLELQDMLPIDVYSIAADVDYVLAITGWSLNFSDNVAELRLSRCLTETASVYVE